MESTLSITKSELEADVSIHAGFDPDVSALTDAQAARVARAIKTGLSYFYFPASYEWSFLKPVATVTFAEGQDAVDLPDDFNYLNGKVVPASSGGESQFPVSIVSEGDIVQQYSLTPNFTGRPRMAAIRNIRGTSLNESTRTQLWIFPTADQAYTLQLPYSILPNTLSEQAPYFHGGAAHAATIVAACKFAYSEAYDGMAMAQEWGQNFQRLLQMSIEQDRKRKPSNFGYNGDSSDAAFIETRHGMSWAPIMVNGIAPGPV